MSLFASQRIRNRIDDIDDRAHRAMRSAADAVDDARHAARPAVDDVQSLLRSLESAIHTLTDEGGTEARRASRTLHARADQLRRAANDRAHQARDRMDWALSRTEDTITSAPFKSVGVAVAIGAAIGLVVALAGGSRREPSE
ncbi:YqjD family protein [Ralstonia sp. ASV6]|uniref:DUF883 family protein n=1 Tax=Ralstonia sp. ASV6 TaxID=2795124 RepID=UPI0018EAB23A|nr:DUF883 family protein [Ralstonia sp. ASV6]